MLDKILFYNFWHFGDIHVSRSLVKFIVNNIPAKEYQYHHYNGPKILQDIPKLNYQLLTFSEDFKWKGWWRENEILYCNTWYNAYQQQEFKGCTIQTLFNIFKRGLKETINYDLPENPIDYLPEIDNSYYPFKQPFDVLENIVLISNCDVLSGQSNNFDFNPIINYIANKFPSLKFVITNKNGNGILLSNVYYFQDIVKVSGCDLNEISLFSKNIPIIVGRNSGPHTFCFTKENLMNKDKVFVCFSHEEFGILGTAKATMVLSSNFDRDVVAAHLELIIRERFEL